MPNFDARVRNGYVDVQGLVLDLNVNGLARDGSSWRNDAPARRLTPANQPRYKNAVQSTPSKRPALGFIGQIPHFLFTKANLTSLELAMEGDFGAQKEDYTFAYEMPALGSDSTINQVIFGADELDLYARNNPGTLYGWRTDAVGATQAGPHPSGVFVYVLRSAGLMRRYRNGSIEVSGAGAPITLGDESQNPVATIGASNTGAQAFDGALRSVRVWNRALLDEEIDYIFQTLGAGGADHSSGNWVETETRIWNDRTAIPRRVNPTIEVPHRFLVAKFPTGGSADLVIEATIDGVLTPDSGLGGDLFSASALEKPAFVPPFVGPVAAGWSALQKITLEYAGHYTIEMRRANGGAIIFHVDAEEV